MKVCRFLALALFAITMSFTACGDDESSSGVAPESAGEISTNSSASSSSVKSSTSGKSSAKSSSSEKSSSSAKSSAGGSSAKSSSSLNSSGDSNSSSSVWTRPCSSEGEALYRKNKQTGEQEVYVCHDGYYVPYIESSSSAQPRSSYIDMDSLYNSTLSYGEFKDPRDGQTYKTIVEKPGWVSVPEFEAFAQNLNYGVQIKLGATEFDDSKVEKYCYDDDPWYCDNGFGGLYSWSEAMGLPKACDSVWTGTTPACPDSIFPGWKYEEEWHDLMIQGACPEGWHVMNRTEWMALRGMDVTETGWALISVVSKGGNGTGFSAVFGGIAHATTLFENIQKYGSYHLAWEVFADGHRSVTMSDNPDINSKCVNTDYNNYKKDGLSVRCVKDY